MRGCFVVPAVDIVDSVVLNGHVKARDRATGREVEPCIISVGAQREVFGELMNMTVNITQSSRDEGIDAVAYDKTDVVHRAEYIIQAKRYSKCVPTESVRALVGVVEKREQPQAYLSPHPGSAPRARRSPRATIA
jgi:hypothetical protein